MNIIVFFLIQLIYNAFFEQKHSSSVESFERKLEEAQKALNIAPRDYVPVLYVDETGFMNEPAKLIPVIALIGRNSFVHRIASSCAMT